MNGRQLRWIGGALFVVSVAACTSVGTVGYPAEYIATKAPGHVWITNTDKTVMELYNPQIKGDSGDTLVGFSKTGEYTEMPVANVQLMRTKMASPMRTALLAGSVALGTALIISKVQGTAPTNLCFPPGGGNMGLPVPCPKPA